MAHTLGCTGTSPLDSLAQPHAALHAPLAPCAASHLCWFQTFTCWPFTKTRLMDLPLSATSTRFLADTTSILAACEQKVHVSTRNLLPRMFPCLSSRAASAVV